MMTVETVTNHVDEIGQQFNGEVGTVNIYIGPQAHRAIYLVLPDLPEGRTVRSIHFQIEFETK